MAMEKRADHQPDHQMVNRLNKEKKMAKIRQDIMAFSPEKALDAVLGSDQPATLVQSFPDQDLHYLMTAVGLDDFWPVLSMAASSQWEYILDMEVWEDDKFMIPSCTKYLDALFKADPKRLLRWMVSEKPDFLEYYFLKNMEIKIREHDEDPSTLGEGFITLDSLFYIRFPEIPETLLKGEGANELQKTKQTAETLIMAMLKGVAEMDLSVFQALLMETASVIASETEEEQYRLRSVRLAEKGFLPLYEAVGIYQPMDPDKLTRRPALYLKSSFIDSDLPMPANASFSMLGNDSFFAKAFFLLDESSALNLQMEFAALVSTLASADKIMIREPEDLQKVVGKACDYLSLGLEMIHGKEGDSRPENGAIYLRNYTLETIFRVASGAGLKLKLAAKKWYNNCWAHRHNFGFNFFDEQWLGLLGGLFLDRPLYFDNYRSGFLYRAFASLSDITETSDGLYAIMAVDELMALFDPDLAGVDAQQLTYKNVLLTLWMRHRLGLEPTLAPVKIDHLRQFFKQLFSDEEKRTIPDERREDLVLWLNEAYGMDAGFIGKKLGAVFKRLFDELEDEYGLVELTDLDPILITQFWLTA